MQVQSLGGKIPRRRAWQPTSVFLPGEAHGHRSLVGYSLWVHKEHDTTEAYSFRSRGSSYTLAFYVTESRDEAGLVTSHIVLLLGQRP